MSGTPHERRSTVVYDSFGNYLGTKSVVHDSRTVMFLQNILGKQCYQYIVPNNATFIVNNAQTVSIGIIIETDIRFCFQNFTGKTGGDYSRCRVGNSKWKRRVNGTISLYNFHTGSTQKLGSKSPCSRVTRINKNFKFFPY